MGSEVFEVSDPPADAGLKGGLERDLESLHGLLDAAVEQLRLSFMSMTEAMNSDPAAERLGERFRTDVDRVITNLQFHDLASQMISNMRARVGLLETVALTGAPAEARLQLLAQALQVSTRFPHTACDRSGEVDLF